jgi:pimeloyl-ACP methyl ester carboxylesterase
LAIEIIVFSGLGADESVFHKLDFTGYKVTYIKWIIPKSTETIEQYASRLVEQISPIAPILLGLSFGGIIAIEVAKQIKTQKVILISSAKTKHEIPFYYRWTGYINLHRLLPIGIMKKTNFITYWFFGVSSITEKSLLKVILENTDPTFLKWAIDKIAKWKNEIKLENCFHIHGSNDKLLPIAFIKPDFLIENGGHFMVLNRADEINIFIQKKLRKHGM